MIPALTERLNLNSSNVNVDPESQGLVPENQSSFSSIAGVIDQAEIQRLRRLIFRATKGKSYVFIEEYEPTDNQVSKARRSVYIIMFWEGANLRDRITKICDSFSGERFDVPQTPTEIFQKLESVETAIVDARSVLN